MFLVILTTSFQLTAISFLTLLLSASLTRGGGRLRGSALAGHVAVLSILVLALAKLLSGGGDLGPTKPASLIVISERYTPAGLVQVIDLDGNPSKRFLRVDASVLGGVTVDSTGKIVTGKDGNNLLNAARLISGSDGKNALILYVFRDFKIIFLGLLTTCFLSFLSGLQDGATASSYIAHGYNVSVVEARRAVFDAARAYLGMPAPVALAIEEVPFWVAQAASTATQEPPLAETDKFDVIVHDLLEAGEMPSRTFTMEFWEQLKALLREHGVIALVR